MSRHVTKIACVCERCGKTFFVNPCRVRQAAVRRCSNACRQYTAEDFWSCLIRNEVTGCWLWPGSRIYKYGQMVFQGKRYRTHRLAWELIHGLIPDGLNVLHNCPAGDNPLCSNPAHLFLGTHTDNRADCVNKNRQAKGAANAMSKLTEAQRQDILARYEAGGITQVQLASEYHVTQAHVWRIVHRIPFTHSRRGQGEVRARRDI